MGKSHSFLSMNDGWGKVEKGIGAQSFTHSLTHALTCLKVDGSAWGYTGPGFSVDDPYGHFYTDGGWGTWNGEGKAKGICEKVKVVPSFKGYVNDGISKGDEVVLLHMQSLGKDKAANIESMENK